MFRSLLSLTLPLFMWAAGGCTTQPIDAVVREVPVQSQPTQPSATVKSPMAPDAATPPTPTLPEQARDAGQHDAGASPLLADSVAEFSTVQGQDGWSYGYYTAPFTPDTFSKMTVLFEGRWLIATEYWTTVAADFTHSQGTSTSGGRTPADQWAVRRWTSDFAGDATLDVVASRPEPIIDGTPIELVIFKNTERLQATRVGNQKVRFSLAVELALGDHIDFALDPVESNDWGDKTRFAVKIVRTAP